jgi:outer membrane protein OmpA-like peptidoglycan-associated protein
MDRWGIPLLGIITLTALCWYCVQHEPHQIEQDLLTRSAAALAAGNIPADGLSIQGQTAYLRGPRGSAIVSDDARQRVEAVWGVTDVIVEPTTQSAPQRPPANAAPPQAVKLEADLKAFLDGKTIRFAPASDVLLPDGRLILDKIAQILLSSGAVEPVEISGHTDADGDAERNLDLSKRRAAAVKRYLVSKGVPAARLFDQGFGAAKPIADNATAEGRARNRRIEFHVKTLESGGGAAAKP